MKKEYDFTNAEQGKFYDKTAKFNIPIYLEPEVESFVMEIAKKRKCDASSVVNQLLAKDRELAEFVAR